MQTKFDVGEKVYVAGEIITIDASKKGTYYSVRIDTEKAYHDIVLKEDDEDLVKIPQCPVFV